MRWPVALLAGYLLLALQPPVCEALRLGSTSAYPSLILPFVVFIALFASPTAALWTGLFAGLAIDLSTPRGDAALIIAGPHALAYLAAAAFVLRTRPLVMRRNPLTLAVLSILAGTIAALIINLLFAVRRVLWGDHFADPLLGDLWQRLIGAAYTGGAALILWAILTPLARFFAFQEQGARRPFVKQH